MIRSPIGIAVGLGLLCLLCPSALAANEYPLCGIDRELFSKFAYPEGIPLMDENLAKWSKPPGLFILSPHQELEPESQWLFEQIDKDDLLSGAPTGFVHYASPGEVYNVVTQHGLNNIFIFVDAAGFAPDPDDLRQAATDILMSTSIVDRLIASAQKVKDFSIQTRINPASGKIYASVALINPNIGPEAVRSTLYTLHYAAVSPPATYRLPDFYSAMFVRTAADGTTHLSEFAKAYYRIVLDPEVPVGASPQYFSECKG